MALSPILLHHPGAALDEFLGGKVLLDLGMVLGAGERGDQSDQERKRELAHGVASWRHESGEIIREGADEKRSDCFRPVSWLRRGVVTRSPAEVIILSP